MITKSERQAILDEPHVNWTGEGAWGVERYCDHCGKTVLFR